MTTSDQNDGADSIESATAVPERHTDDPSPSPVPAVPGPTEPEPPRSWRRPISMWAVTISALLVIQHLSARVFRGDGLQIAGRPLRYFFDSWSQFDGPEYLKIVESGYWYTPGQRSPIVWFPLYPMLVKATTAVVSDPLIAGVVVSAIAGLGAVMALWRWTETQDMTTSNATAALAMCMFYPYAWYLYGVVHADGLFLALAVSAFVLVERDRLFAAGLVGALATASRPTGMALIAGLLALTLERHGVWTSLAKPTTNRLRNAAERRGIPTSLHWDRVRPRLLWPALSMAGVGAYAMYLWAKWGDPIAFITNERVYHPGGLPWLKLAFFVAWRDFEDPTHVLTITLQAFFALTVIALCPKIGRRFGWGYAVYCFTLVMIPTVSTEDFMGTGRYLIAAFPAWALVGEMFATRWVRHRWVIGVSAALMIAMAAAFARSWYLT